MRAAARWACLLSASVFAAVAVSAAPAANNGHLKQALAGLKSGAFTKRLDAVDALSKLKNPAAVDAVIGALKDPDATVRWSACAALETMGDARATRPLQEAQQDASPLVSDRARQALRALTRGTSGVAPGALAVKMASRDLSKSGIANLDGELQNSAATALGASRVRLAGSVDAASHAVFVAVQSVKEKPAGKETQLEVFCTATVTEQPGNQLRFATRIGATLSQDGLLSPALREELAREAVRAAGQGLGEESAGWLLKAR